jgi:energy-converting hydrogenase Eha subunit B
MPAKETIMIGKAIAAYLGNRIDRRDGKGGTLGAMTGVAVYGLGKRVLPVAILAGGAAIGMHYLQKRFRTPA